MIPAGRSPWNWAVELHKLLSEQIDSFFPLRTQYNDLCVAREDLGPRRADSRGMSKEPGLQPSEPEPPPPEHAQVNEALQSMASVKMYAWESRLAMQINGHRAQEIHQRRGLASLLAFSRANMMAIATPGSPATRAGRSNRVSFTRRNPSYLWLLARRSACTTSRGRSS